MTGQQPIPRNQRLRTAALLHDAIASNLRFQAAASDATDAINAFTRAWRRREEAAFLEIVVRFDEFPARRVNAYAHRARWRGRRPRR